MNTSEVNLGILLGFSKAFDTIDHLTLLQIEVLKVIQSYISEWRQYEQIGGKTSYTQLNNFGAPQGSILGPVLFKLCIVNIIDNISCNSLQQADDITLHQYCKLKKLQNCIEKVRIRPRNCVRLGLTDQFRF